MISQPACWWLAMSSSQESRWDHEITAQDYLFSHVAFCYSYHLILGTYLLVKDYYSAAGSVRRNACHAKFLCSLPNIDISSLTALTMVILTVSNFLLSFLYPHHLFLKDSQKIWRNTKPRGFLNHGRRIKRCFLKVFPHTCLTTENCSHSMEIMTNPYFSIVCSFTCLQNSFKNTEISEVSEVEVRKCKGR